MGSSVVIPITFWDSSLPVFRISTICISPNYEKLVTGSYSGQMCIWNLDLKNEEITPKNLLIGHKQSVTCLASTNEFVISSCEGREICRWNLDDGYCTKMNKSLFIHRKMQFFRKSDSSEELLFTSGDYSEIFVIHPFTLQVSFILHSRNDFNWISSFHVVPSQNNKSDIVSGITGNGCIKLWVLGDLLDDSQYEIHSNCLPASDVVDLKYNSARTQVLIVSAKYWMLFDSELSNCLGKVESCGGERLLGGNFCDFNVVVWTNSGKFYVYDISRSNQELISVHLDHCSQISMFEPAMTVIQVDKKYLIRGDLHGKINIWKLNLQEKHSYPSFSTSLKDRWIGDKNKFFEAFLRHSTVTSCLYILAIDKFILGCFDGTIILIPASESILSFYFCSTTKQLSNSILVGHNGKVNCLLYPHEKYKYFCKSHLVSGSSDFSVCLWDIFKEELIYKFCVQSGEILSLIVPPEDCSAHIKFSVCSVSSDHSVAILNLRDKRCVILMSRHEFPVVMVHWRPLDDFIIIECFDGTVYVWQMETGHLDRVLDGLMAQEVIYACSEAECVTPIWNFYIDEHIARRNCMKRQVFQMNEATQASDSPLLMNGFLTSEKSESQIFVCNMDFLSARFSYLLDASKTEPLSDDITKKMYSLTQVPLSDVEKKPVTLLEKMKREADLFQEKFHPPVNEGVEAEAGEEVVDPQNGVVDPQDGVEDPALMSDTILKMIRFFLSVMHFWGVDPSFDEKFSTQMGFLKPESFPTFGIMSHPGIYSLFLPMTEKAHLKSSSFVTTACIAIITLSKILGMNHNLTDLTESNCWEELFSFYELLSVNPNLSMTISTPKVEILAKVWQTKSLTLRTIVRKLLAGYLQSLDVKENAKLLEFWYKYLPHFKILDKTLPEKVDFENVELKTVALVLFGAVGSDLKFIANDSSCQENYVYQTCASFVYLMLLPKEQKYRFSTLQTIAVDFLGRGYIVWEQFLKMEKIVPVLLKMCRFSKMEDVPTDESLAAHDALRSIAVARTAAFISCLTNEITQNKLVRSEHFVLDQSKADILSILTFLLEKTPYIMLLYLNDVVSIIVYCIDLTHLKQENLVDLLPVMRKFRQVHHSVASQRIAVGLATGFLVLHDLRTGKSHEIPAHKDSVSALKFSEDGKFLASYSCYENRLSFWRVLTGIFGLGHVNVKCTKSCQTCHIHDEEIRNHLEIASLTWTDKKSVVLSLCDGSETIFHS